MSCPISSDAISSFEFIFTDVNFAIIITGLFMEWNVRKEILGPVAYRYCIDRMIASVFQVVCRWYVSPKSWIFTEAGRQGRLFRSPQFFYKGSLYTLILHKSVSSTFLVITSVRSLNFFLNCEIFSCDFLQHITL